MFKYIVWASHIYARTPEARLNDLFLRSYSSGQIILQTNGGVGNHQSAALKINSSANIGLSKDPDNSYKLDVNGKINCTELYVNGNPFNPGGLQPGDNISELNNNSGYVTLTSAGIFKNKTMEIPNGSYFVFKENTSASNAGMRK